MSDYFQTDAIATLHRLGPSNVAALERDLESFSRETPIEFNEVVRLDNA